MRARAILSSRWTKLGLFLVCLVPFLKLAVGLVTGSLGNRETAPIGSRLSPRHKFMRATRVGGGLENRRTYQKATQNQ